MSQQLETLQEQVNGLYSNITALQQKVEIQHRSSASVGALDPQIAYQAQPPSEVRVKTQSTPHPPHFSGPTSTVYDFDVANNSLQSMGIKQPGYGADDATNGHDTAMVVSAHGSSPSVGNIVVQQQEVGNSGKDPLVSLSQEEVLRLCKVYDEEVATTAPLLDMEEVTKKAKTLYNFMDSMRRIGFLQKGISQGESFRDDETLILKMVLAVALTVENGGQNDMGRAIFEHVRHITNMQDRLGAPASVKYLQLLTITVCFSLCSLLLFAISFGFANIVLPGPILPSIG